MATILIVDDDPMVLRLAEGTLARAGHAVQTTDLPGQVLDMVAQGAFDALILDVMMPGMNGLDILEAIRNRSGTTTMPVLLLSALSGSDDRVRGLERGADDYLVKPFAPDELVLRVTRLLDRATRRESDLSGDLRLVSVPEVLQTLQHSEAHGTLEITTDLCLGSIELCRGRAVSARFGALDGREAVIAMVEHETGRFRFNRTLAEAPAGDGAALPIQHLMFEAAWLRDELARRDTPPADQGLAIAPGWASPPELPEDFEALPVHRVWQALELEPGLRIAEIESRIRSAPGMARLVIALLIEHDAVELTTEHVAAPGDALEVAARELVAEACRRRGEESLVQMLLVADEGVVGDLLSMRQEIPQRLMAAPGDSLMGAWRAGRIASLPLDAGDATLVVQMAPERGHLARQVENTLDRHASVVIWSGDGSAPGRLGWLLDEVERAPSPSWGLVVVPDRNATFRAALATTGLERWTVAQLRPTDLATFLRAVRAAAGASEQPVSFDAWGHPEAPRAHTMPTA